MTRSILIYAALLAVLVLGLQWLEYQYMARSFTTEIYIVLIALGFAALGLWLGRVLTPKAKADAFCLNQAALETLGITKREYAVLERLADGHSNKQIADLLHVSPNTVKTHIAKLYEKLDVNQRLQAVQKAKDLQLIP
ncbi:MAG: response regulator transcription factor [Henriciella sp.]|nr:response regulator transcription factor [Henriciella sp.]